MQAIIFIGIPGSGKSTFYKERFFKTHIRINLDMLKTRHREKILTAACIEAKQPFVSDNTNPTREGRAKIILPAKEARFTVIGYFFEMPMQLAIERNTARPIEEQVPIKGIGGIFKQLERPKFEEGFDQLFFVKSGLDNVFIVEAWADEI